MKPGDAVKIKDINVVALEAFDRTALVTCGDPEEVLKGKMPQEMDQIAVNYLFGNIRRYSLSRRRSHIIPIYLPNMAMTTKSMSA